MKAVVCHSAGDLRIDELPETPPGEGEVRVRIAAGGICGSDLHYFRHGGFGAVRLREPMVLGHEVAGTVEAVGPGVEALRPGRRVAVNPSRPCLACACCREAKFNHCLDMRFFGSAMRFPHVAGGFAQSVTVAARQAVPVADRLTIAEAAMAEPLSVGLHAVRRAGPLLGKRVLVTGCGPIGSLAIAAALHAGAREVVAADIAALPLATALAMGASRAVNLAENPDGLAPDKAGKGSFDVMFEASGSEAALCGALEAMRPGGIVVQMGNGADMTLPISFIVGREIELRGTFRFHEEFELAVALMGEGRIDVKPVLSRTIPFERAREAFELAGDRNRAMKVQLAFA
jgi:L-idonate 5-dehydrogenase